MSVAAATSVAVSPCLVLVAWILITPGSPVVSTIARALPEQWESVYPALIASWRANWDEFAPFLEFPVEVRKLICTTNAIESLNARFRAATRQRGSFPDETAALKVLSLQIKRREKNKQGPTGRINAWRPVLNVLTLTYGDRLQVN